MMSGLTTIEIFEKLNGKKTNPRIILLTVVRCSEDKKKQIMSRENVVDYITKPFGLDHLIDVVKRYVQQEPLVRLE